MTRPRDVSGQSLSELRVLADRSSRTQLRKLARALAADPRAGAVALRNRIERQLRAERAERARLRRLLVLERRKWREGVQRVAGVDEAGMGPLAGPVVAAAVVLRPNDLIERLDDSKQVPPHVREELAEVVRGRAVAHAIGMASVDEIDRLNVYHAGLLAMRRAVDALEPAAEHVLVDARAIPELAVPQEAHVKGDARSCSIAAASILAKTHRDALMAELARSHPEYGFERNQGYGTAEHLEALRRHGPCAAHRIGYRAVAEHGGRWSDAFYALRDTLEEVRSEEELDAWRRAVPAQSDPLTTEELKQLDRLAGRSAKALRSEGATPAQGWLLA